MDINPFNISLKTTQKLFITMQEVALRSALSNEKITKSFDIGNANRMNIM